MNAEPSLPAVLASLKERQGIVRDRMVRDRAEDESLTMAIQGIEGLVPASGPPPDADEGADERVQSSGRSVITRRPGRTAIDVIGEAIRSSPAGLSLPDLTLAAARLGFRPDSALPDRAVRASANRLRERDDRYDLANGRYVFLPKHGQQTLGGS